MNIALEFEREDDGRWIAEAPELPGVLAYGASRAEAGRRAFALALRVLADRLENGELLSDMNPIFLAEAAGEHLAGR